MRAISKSTSPAPHAVSLGLELISGARNKLRDPTGKAGQIVRVMEERLTIGFYASGEMVSFAALAEEFGVSRQPVSAAISHLRSSGYVEVIPQVGCRVVLPSPREITDFFFILSKIEGAVVSLAAARYEGDEAKTLMAIVPPSMRRLDALHQRKAYLNYLDRYHDQIWIMTRTPLLEGKISALRRLSNFYLMQGSPKLAPKAAQQLIHERQVIAKAIADRNVKLAAQLAERHINNKPKIIGVIRKLG